MQLNFIEPLKAFEWTIYTLSRPVSGLHNPFKSLLNGLYRHPKGLYRFYIDHPKAFKGPTYLHKLFTSLERVYVDTLNVRGLHTPLKMCRKGSM